MWELFIFQASSGNHIRLCDDSASPSLIRLCPSHRVGPQRPNGAALPVLREEGPRTQLHALQTLLLHFLCTRVRPRFIGLSTKEGSCDVTGPLDSVGVLLSSSSVTGCGVCGLRGGAQVSDADTSVNESSRTRKHHHHVSLCFSPSSPPLRFNVRLTKRLRALSAGSRSEKPRPALNRAESVPGKPLLLRLVGTLNS